MGDIHKNRKGYPTWNDSGLLVHRTVAKAPAGSVVHHRDGDRSNFRKSNLQVMSRSSHSRLHARKRSNW